MHALHPTLASAHLEHPQLPAQYRQILPAGPSSSSAAVAAPPPPPPDKALDPTHHRPSAPRLHERNFGALGS
ncbi:hypothetical protein JCM3775_006217 [Rhodotorula graminis]